MTMNTTDPTSPRSLSSIPSPGSLSAIASSQTIDELVTMMLALTSRLDRTNALNFIAQKARDIAQAEYSAIGIMDSRGSITEFVTSGMSTEQSAHLPIPLPREEVFTDVSVQSINVHNDLPLSTFTTIFPEHLLKIHNFAGLPVIVDGKVWGRLFIANAQNGFSDETIYCLNVLTQAAAVAVNNTLLYAQAQSRSRWLTASQDIVASLLEDADEETALQLITDEMLIAGRADVAMMVLPSIGDTWACEFVAGEDSAQYLGVTFPPEGRARTVIKEQAGIVVDSMQSMPTVRVTCLRKFGPVLYAPLITPATQQSAHGNSNGGRGVIVLLRYPNSPEFDLNDLAMAETVAQQATIALELAEARRTKMAAAELDERSRISRDLHDLAIQQLFASGMHITAVREELAMHNPPKAVTAALDKALGAIDASVGQIRTIVQSLRDEGASLALVDRLGHETTMALQSLGFAPSLVVTFNGKQLIREEFTLIDDAAGADISDDVVAVVREALSNAARHAHASSVAISIDATPTHITVRVIDDGTGVNHTLSRRSGLSNLAARARRHHGSFFFRQRSDGVRGAELEWTASLS